MKTPVRFAARRSATLAVIVSAAIAMAALPDAALAARMDAAFAVSGGHALGGTAGSRWTEMTHRLAVQPQGTLASCRGQAEMTSAACRLVRWNTTLTLARTMDRDNQIAFVQQAVNRLPYRADRENWGRADYWETPAEMLARGGDCEGFALTKYFALRALGVADTDMRIAVVWDSRDREEHAVLLVRDGGEIWLLDNKMAGPERMSGHRDRYSLIYYVNEGEGLRLPAQERQTAQTSRVRLTDDGRTLVLVVNARSRADRDDRARIAETMPAGR